MKNFSNTYIFVFASVMVIVVAALLSSAAMLLQPMQEKNIEIARKGNILASINIESDSKTAEELYDKYIPESFVLDVTGERREGVDAFYVNMTEEVRKEEDRNLPLFVGVLDNGEKQYVIPVRGVGLWGPIYGYISLNADFNTLFGTSFGHDGETPGLGSEITADWFQDQFSGKQIFSEGGEFTSITVTKGKADPGSMNEVDGISGSTLTSVGLENMLRDCLKYYEPYFKAEMED